MNNGSIVVREVRAIAHWGWLTLFALPIALLASPTGWIRLLGIGYTIAYLLMTLEGASVGVLMLVDAVRAALRRPMLFCPGQMLTAVVAQKVVGEQPLPTSVRLAMAANAPYWLLVQVSTFIFNLVPAAQEGMDEVIEFVESNAERLAKEIRKRHGEYPAAVGAPIRVAVRAVHKHGRRPAGPDFTGTTEETMVPHLV